MFCTKPAAQFSLSSHPGRRSARWALSGTQTPLETAARGWLSISNSLPQIRTQDWQPAWPRACFWACSLWPVVPVPPVPRGPPGRVVLSSWKAPSTLLITERASPRSGTQEHPAETSAYRVKRPLDWCCGISEPKGAAGPWAFFRGSGRSPPCSPAQLQTDAQESRDSGWTLPSFHITLCTCLRNKNSKIIILTIKKAPTPK